MSSIHQLKTHKVDKETWNYARNHVKDNGFVLTIDLKTVCGADAMLIAYKWTKVDCKKCLRRK